MATPTGQCPNCRQINSYAAIKCLDCGERLPWADVVESKTSAEQEAQRLKEKAVEAQQAALKVHASPMPPGQRATGTAGAYDGYCRHCGKGYDGNPTYCPRCGGVLAPPLGGRPSFGVAPWMVLLLLALIGGWIFLGSSLNTVITSADPAATPVVAFDENHIDKAGLESEVLSSYNEALSAKGRSFTCTSVNLVEAAPRHFTGFAELTNGDKPNVDVTFDKDGSYIYKIGGD